MMNPMKDFLPILVILLLSFSNSIAFRSSSKGRDSFSTRSTLKYVSSSDMKNNADVSYLIARGDGSTGGGGLPMPGKDRDDDSDGLVRPKVNVLLSMYQDKFFMISPKR